MFTRNTPLLRRLAFGLVALCLAFVLTLAVSPVARAHVEEVIRRVGDLIIHETGGPLVYGEDYDEDSFQLPGQIVSLAEARNTLPFTFDLPTWLPTGFVLREEQVFVEVLQEPVPMARMLVKWENMAVCEESPELCELSEANPDRAFLPAIFLVATYAPGQDMGEKIKVGLGSVEEVTVNGEPMALIRGGWDDESGEFVQNGALFLFWQESDDLLYYVQSLERDNITPDDLIRIVESLP